MFTGEYRHTVDENGRIAVPARFRVQLGAGAVVSRWLDACLSIHTQQGWDELAAKVAALRKNPRVALTVDRAGMPPRTLLVRGGAAIEIVDGVPEEYVTAARKIVPAEAMPSWEAGVRALYDEMAVITVTPDHVVLHDFETTLPKAVADVIAAKS